MFSGRAVLRIERDAPGRFWSGAQPRLLVDHRDAGVDALIDQVERAVRPNPWPNTCRAFPGPNSNTCTACIAKAVPALILKLPFLAIGSSHAN